MARNVKHLDNFLTTAAVRFEIADFAMDAVKGMTRYVFASGKTLEEAKERFYSRIMIRAVEAENEIVFKAQARGSLRICKVENNHSTLVDADPMLLAIL